MGDLSFTERQIRSDAEGFGLEERIIFGLSEALRIVRKRVEKVASTSLPLLIQGEPGTGKEFLARWVHAHSPCTTGEFVKANCAAIPNQLLESELFGYEKGAFTGANATKPGIVERASNGTLFLDEIPDLDLTAQAKLLQFVQDGSFCRLGDDTERAVQARLICATTRDLDKQVSAGAFRADLFYRINVLQIRLPGLRDRREDIAFLVEYFRQHFMKKFKTFREPMSLEYVAHLKSLQWPGNIRELSNFVARYVLIGLDGIALADSAHSWNPIPSQGAPAAKGIPLKEYTKELANQKERSLLLETLRANKWNRRKAAEALKISYRALIYKIRNAGIPSRRMAARTKDNLAGG